MSMSADSCKDGASKSNEDGVCDVNNKLHNMSLNTDVVVSVCANCGKEGNDVNNTCNKCKMVKYCNAACKKKHRHKHKKECEEHLRLAAKHAAKLHDEKLFKQPPLAHEDCPICFLQLPILDTGRRYQSCCGKTICGGCSVPMITKGTKLITKSVPFAELQSLLQMKRLLKDTRYEWRLEMLMQSTIWDATFIMDYAVCHKIIPRHLNCGIGQGSLVLQ